MLFRHHTEDLAEMGKPGTEVHLVFKLLIDVIVMVVGVSKETIEAATDVMQVLL